MPIKNSPAEEKALRKPSGRFLSGVAILTVSTAIVKLIGLLYKIPLIKVLGEEGMGYFNSAYELYTFFYIIATAGLPVAISIMIATSLEKGNRNNVKKIYNVVFSLLFLIGVTGMVALYYGAGILGELIGNVESTACIAAIAPMALFISVSSAVRGYFQGHQNMMPTAISQVVEALGKLFLGLALAVWAVREGYGIPDAAAFATVGITAGVGLSMLYLLLSKLIAARKNANFISVGEKDSSKKILSGLIKIAIPITLSSLVMSLTRVVDLFMIMHRLKDIGYTSGAANAIYGSYSTLAVSMYNLPGAFVTPIAISLVPILTATVHSSDKIRERRILNSSIRLCGLITIPASLGLSIFSRPILELIFAGETSAINIAAPLLSVLGISVFFSSIMTVTNSILQAYGMERKPIISMFVGAAVKTILSYILIGIPQINIYGAPISTLVCAATVVFINLYYIKKATGELDGAIPLFIKPTLAAVVAIGGAGAIYYAAAAASGESYLLTLASIALAVFAYGLSCLKMKAISGDDITLLPFGDKIEKLLRKVKLL